jgi:hypothetical protein
MSLGSIESSFDDIGTIITESGGFKYQGRRAGIKKAGS